MNSQSETQWSGGLWTSVTAALAAGIWGIYWAPLRALEAAAFSGPWATVAVLLVGCLVLTPFAWIGCARIFRSNKRALGSIAVGGIGFILYSNGLIYGQVAVVTLLFYLTPVWSVLIAWIWLGLRPTLLRYATIGLGLGGIALVLQGAHGNVPLPTTMGDWFGLTSGVLWSIASTGISTQVRTTPAETNFLFLLAALVAAVVLALVVSAGKFPQLGDAATMPALGWTFVLGAGWWAGSLTVVMWAAKWLEPARLGVLFMTEALVATLTAGLFSPEPFGPLIAVGAVLVLAATYTETRMEAAAVPTGS